MELCLSDWKTVAEIFESASKALAVIVGGIWTYQLFVKNRLSYPKLDISIVPKTVLLPNSRRLIHATVNIKNVGKVILRSDRAELRLRLIVPLPEQVASVINHGYDPVDEGKSQVAWPMISGREWFWKEKEFEIEPDESGTLHADYVIDETISAVEFYCFIGNSRKEELGWSCTLIYVPELSEKTL